MLVSHRRKVAWLPQHISPIPGFTVRESVVYAGWLGAMSFRQADAKADAVLAAVSLTEKSHEAAKSLSGGQLRRLGIAQALVRDATWLLLDEPFAGLDPIERAPCNGCCIHGLGR